MMNTGMDLDNDTILKVLIDQQAKNEAALKDIRWLLAIIGETHTTNDALEVTRALKRLYILQ